MDVYYYHNSSISSYLVDNQLIQQPHSIGYQPTQYQSIPVEPSLQPQSSSSVQSSSSPSVHHQFKQFCSEHFCSQWIIWVLIRSVRELMILKHEQYRCRVKGIVIDTRWVLIILSYVLMGVVLYSIGFYYSLLLYLLVVPLNGVQVSSPFDKFECSGLLVYLEQEKQYHDITTSYTPIKWALMTEIINYSQTISPKQSYQYPDTLPTLINMLIKCKHHYLSRIRQQYCQCNNFLTLRLILHSIQTKLSQQQQIIIKIQYFKNQHQFQSYKIPPINVQYDKVVYYQSLIKQIVRSRKQENTSQYYRLVKLLYLSFGQQILIKHRTTLQPVNNHTTTSHHQQQSIPDHYDLPNDSNQYLTITPSNHIHRTNYPNQQHPSTIIQQLEQLLNKHKSIPKINTSTNLTSSNQPQHNMSNPTSFTNCLLELHNAPKIVQTCSIDEYYE